jgi:hypothetical protein
MRTKAYTLLGWLTWHGITILARRKLGQNKAKLMKLGALATVVAVLVGGVLTAKAAKAASDES